MSCCLSYKDTILKANHSLFLERFTISVLLLILQRYYFESESQLDWVLSGQTISCCLSYKDTILKANHSIIALSKLRSSLLLILQRYYFESESQLNVMSNEILFCCCLSYKDTILKANHSSHAFVPSVKEAVAYPTKILFWKRITAHGSNHQHTKRLLLILQRYYFESESQRITETEYNLLAVAYPTKILFWKRITALSIVVLFLHRCCLSYKDTILKANHSSTNTSCSATFAVAYPTKILFWKRITAQHDIDNMALMLLLILQRYYFESESQRRR